MVRFLLREHLDEIDTSLAQSVEGSDGGEEKIANRSRENPTAPRLSGLGQIFGFLSWIHEKFNHVLRKVSRLVMSMRCAGVSSIASLVFGAMGASCCLFRFALVPFSGIGISFQRLMPANFDCTFARPPGHATRIHPANDFFRWGTPFATRIPPNEIQNVLDNIGLPTSGINLAFSDSSTISSADGEILVALNRKS